MIHKPTLLTLACTLTALAFAQAGRPGAHVHGYIQWRHRRAGQLVDQIRRLGQKPRGHDRNQRIPEGRPFLPAQQLCPRRARVVERIVLSRNDAVEVKK